MPNFSNRMSENDVLSNDPAATPRARPDVPLLDQWK